MNQPAQTVKWWGCYLIGLSGTLLFVPNLLLRLFQFAPTNEVWIRVMGMLLFFLATYCLAAARLDFHPYFWWSVYTRGSVILFFIVFVAAGLAPVQLLLFGLIDLAGAAWTWWALQREGQLRLA